MITFKTFAINVASNTYRRDHILAQADKAGVDIQIFNAVTPDTMEGIPHHYNKKRARRFTGRPMMPTEIAAGLSHIQLWRQLQADKDVDHYLILEDDIDIIHNMNDIIQSIDLANIHFLKLSGQCNRPMKKNAMLPPMLQQGSHDGVPDQVKESNSVGFTIYRYAFGPLDAAAYLISKIGAQKLGTYCQSLHTPIDILMDRSYDHGVTIYGVLPYAVTTQFNFDENDPLFTDVGVRDQKYAPDITTFEKLMVKYHRLCGSVKRHLATIRLNLVKE